MRVALFVTCLAEAFAPEVADAAAALVRRTAVDLEVVPVGLSCCGQPAWNAGYPAEATALARRLLPRLLPFDRVVVPSGSCATMLVRYYPHLFPQGDPLAAAAAAVASRTSELTAFLAAGLPPVAAADPAAGPQPWQGTDSVVFHPSCHSLRGVGVGDSGERCLAAAGCPLRRQTDREECCGFGGLFSIKEEPLSTAMADRKLEGLLAAGAETVATAELGCLLHLEGRARRRGLRLQFRHIAEILAERDRP